MANCEEQNLWKKASEHYLRKGLEQGEPDIEVAKGVRRKIIRQQEYGCASALDAVVCGGTWHTGRGGYKSMCLRCGKEEDAWHAYWECIDLANHGDERVSKTNCFKSKFQD